MAKPAIVVMPGMITKSKTGLDLLRSKYELLFPQTFQEIAGKQDSVLGIILADQKFGSTEMDLFKNLRTAARTGTGYDNIDVEAAKKRNIIVTRVSALNAKSVSEYALGLTLSLLRKINVSHGDFAVSGKWERNSGLLLSEAVVGLVGMGAIGRSLAEKLHALGAKEILGWNRTPRPAVESTASKYCVEMLPLDDLLKRSDAVLICLALSADTKNLIDKRKLELMRPESVLINVSRGAVVDEEALIERLEAGKLGGAALDVFSKEPPTEDFFKKFQNIAASGKNIILTPHLGSLTSNVVEESSMTVAKNIIAVLEGKLEGLDIVNNL